MHFNQVQETTVPALSFNEFYFYPDLQNPNDVEISTHLFQSTH